MKDGDGGRCGADGAVVPAVDVGGMFSVLPDMARRRAGGGAMPE